VTPPPVVTLGWVELNLMMFTFSQVDFFWPRNGNTYASAGNFPPQLYDGAKSVVQFMRYNGTKGYLANYIRSPQLYKFVSTAFNLTQFWVGGNYYSDKNAWYYGSQTAVLQNCTTNPGGICSNTSRAWGLSAFSNGDFSLYPSKNCELS
jgi:hypothetical protein